MPVSSPPDLFRWSSGAVSGVASKPTSGPSCRLSTPPCTNRTECLHGRSSWHDHPSKQQCHGLLHAPLLTVLQTAVLVPLHSHDAMGNEALAILPGPPGQYAHSSSEPSWKWQYSLGWRAGNDTARQSRKRRPLDNVVPSCVQISSFMQIKTVVWSLPVEL